MKPNSRSLLRALLPFLLPLAAAPLAAGEVTVFVGPPGGVGRVEVHDDGGLGIVSAPAELSGVRLLDLEVSGRTLMNELLPDHPRLRHDVPGGARIELPLGQGSLYHYQRPDASAAPDGFGLFLVGADGIARSVLELPGTGAAGDVDPLVTTIGVAPTGDAVLVATTVAAGGDLLEVDLVTNVAVDRTASLPPLAFATGGLRLAPAWGVGASATGLQRFARAPGAQAAAVTFPAATPSFFQGDVVVSEDGSAAVTVAGASAGSLDVFAFGASGDATQLSFTGGPLTGGGFLPGKLYGPHLAIAPDGSRCGWRAEGISREVFVADVTLAPTSSQLTSDARFTSTLDETAGLWFFSPTSLLFMVGDTDDPVLGGVDAGDVYRADLGPAPGQVTLTNVSLTSGDAVEPFVARGTLKSEGGVWRVDGFPGFLMYADQSGGQGDLITVRHDTTGTQLLRAGIKEVEAVERAGTEIVLWSRSSSGSNPMELLRVSSQVTSATMLATLPNGTTLDRFSARPDGLLGAVVGVGLGQWLVAVDVPLGTASLMVPYPMPFGPATAFSSSGRLAGTVDVTPGWSVTGTWTPGGAVLPVFTGYAPAHLLPGA
jgi:hypothetical protein